MILRLSNTVAVETTRVISVTENAGDAVVKLATDGGAVESITVANQSADDVLDKLEAASGNRN